MLEDNIVAGRLAEDLIAISDWRTLKAPRRFWERLRELCDEQLPPPYEAAKLEDRPMSDVQARAFGASTIGFGKHQGKRVDDVPIEYLHFLVDEAGGQFVKQLRRYLRSERVQREQASV